MYLNQTLRMDESEEKSGSSFDNSRSKSIIDPNNHVREKEVVVIETVLTRTDVPDLIPTTSSISTTEPLDRGCVSTPREKRSLIEKDVIGPSPGHREERAKKKERVYVGPMRCFPKKPMDKPLFSSFSAAVSSFLFLGTGSSEEKSPSSRWPLFTNSFLLLWNQQAWFQFQFLVQDLLLLAKHLALMCFPEIISMESEDFHGQPRGPFLGPEHEMSGGSSFFTETPDGRENPLDAETTKLLEERRENEGRSISGKNKKPKNDADSLEKDAPQPSRDENRSPNKSTRDSRGNGEVDTVSLQKTDFLPCEDVVSLLPVSPSCTSSLLSRCVGKGENPIFSSVRSDPVYPNCSREEPTARRWFPPRWLRWFSQTFRFLFAKFLSSRERGVLWLGLVRLDLVFMEEKLAFLVQKASPWVSGWDDGSLFSSSEKRRETHQFERQGGRFFLLLPTYLRCAQARPSWCGRELFSWQGPQKWITGRRSPCVLPWISSSLCAVRPNGEALYQFWYHRQSKLPPLSDDHVVSEVSVAPNRGLTPRKTSVACAGHIHCVWQYRLRQTYQGSYHTYREQPALASRAVTVPLVSAKIYTRPTTFVAEATDSGSPGKKSEISGPKCVRFRALQKGQVVGRTWFHRPVARQDGCGEKNPPKSIGFPRWSLRTGWVVFPRLFSFFLFFRRRRSLCTPPALLERGGGRGERWTRGKKRSTMGQKEKEKPLVQTGTHGARGLQVKEEKKDAMGLFLKAPPRFSRNCLEQRDWFCHLLLRRDGPSHEARRAARSGVPRGTTRGKNGAQVLSPMFLERKKGNPPRQSGYDGTTSRPGWYRKSPFTAKKSCPVVLFFPFFPVGWWLSKRPGGDTVEGRLSWTENETSDRLVPSFSVEAARWKEVWEVWEHGSLIRKPPCLPRGQWDQRDAGLGIQLGGFLMWLPLPRFLLAEDEIIKKKKKN